MGRYALPLLLLAVLALVPGPAPCGGQDPVRAVWLSREFQVLNLRPDPEFFSAALLRPDGTIAGVVSGTLPGGGAQSYEPAQYPFLQDITGTLMLMTPGEAALGVVHLQSTNEGGGSEVFAGVADEVLTKTAYLPVDRCVYLHIHNPNPIVVQVTVRIFDLNGNPVASPLSIIPALGTTVVAVAGLLPVPPAFTGSAMVQATGLIQVTARYTCAGLGSLPAAPHGDIHLSLPRVPPETPGQVTTTISLQNTASPLVADGRIYYSSGYSEAFALPPLGGLIVHSPFTASGGSAFITSTTPIVAVLRAVAKEGEDQGLYTYRAFAPGQEATSAVALPILFSGYANCWDTGSRIWVKNAG